MDLLTFIFVAAVAVISDGFTVHGPSAPLVAPLGSSVVLSCYVNKPLPMEDLEVEWKITDSETLVHLYQDGESRAEVQSQDYHDRAHFFTEQIQHGNFSLRLDNLRAEDEGEYTCKVYSDQDSGETEVQIKDVERLLVSGSTESISASVGEDITLNCSVDSHITPEHFEQVSWKKTDEDDILVLLYQDNKTLPEAAHERYRDRVEFFADEIPKGNFSLRLKSVRTEDKGVYMCQVFAGRLSANATVELERLGFSVLHIMVLILCISASGSALLLCCLIYCRSPDKGLIVQNSYNREVPLGSSVVLPCHVPPNVLTKDLKVEWRRTRRCSTTLVHLYQDQKPEKPHQDYHKRAHFFTDQIQHGNCSLRLDKLRAEDEGEYTCRVYSKRKRVFSAKTNLVLRFFGTGKAVPLGGSVVLPCKVDKDLLQKSLKVEWRRTDSETPVHLYEGGKSRPEVQHQDYYNRAHFITKKIKDGNFSLRLKKVRAEDEGKYTCKVYIDQDCVRSANKELKLGFIVKRHHTLAPLGSSVVLPCYTDEPLPVEGLEVEWRRKGKALILYQDGESRVEEQQQDYHERAHFITDQIPHGNFSLRLDNLRAEDEGEYTCEVYSDQDCVFSTEINLGLRLLDTVFNLQKSLVVCPNILMCLAFVLWGVTEGSVNESVSCSALYFLRPLMLLWAAPYINNFTGKIETWILYHSYVAEYVVFSVVVYSALLSSVWQKLLNYAELDRAVIMGMFSVVFLSCFCKIIDISRIGQKSGRIIKIYGLVADMIFDILPTLQFVLLFYTFGSSGAGLIIVVILPAFMMMMNNEKWFIRCRVSLSWSLSVTRTVMLIFTSVMNVVMIGLYIMTLEKTTDPLGWACVLLFLQILWTLVKFTDDSSFYISLSRGFHRYVLVYVFGSAVVVFLTSTALITELTLKTVNGDRTVGDLRFIIFPVECLFIFSLLISGIFESQIKTCLQSYQKAVRSRREKRSQKEKATETQEMKRLNTGDPEETQPDSVESQT